MIKSAEEDKEIARDHLKRFIKQKKMRQTQERFFILDKIYSMPSFFDAQYLHGIINQDIRVSLATIYTTLDLFCQCNLIIRHSFGSRVIRYEKMPLSVNHYYKVCLKCKGVKPFTDLKLKKSIELRDSASFSITNHMLYIYGVCKKCSGKKNKENSRKIKR